MKVQTLNENLITALSGVKENKVSICNVIVNRRPLLEALKINKKFDLITLESGKTSWNKLSEHNEYLADSNVQDKPCLRISLDHTVMTLLHQDELDYKCINPAKLDFSCSQSKQGIAIDTRLLIEALDYVLPCIADDEARFVLRCVCFESDNYLKLACADGFRLATIEIPANGIPKDKFLIHYDDIKNQLYPFLKSIKPIGKGKGKSYPETFIQLNDKTIQFSTDGKQVTVGRQDGTYPDYAKLIPDNEQLANAGKIEFMASELLRAVKATSKCSRDGTNIIKLQFKASEDYNLIPSVCYLSAKSEDVGNSITDVDCRVSKDCRIALNATYLMDFLNQCDNSIITAYVMSESSPMTFESSSNSTTVLMPMFIRWDEQPEIES